MKTAEELLLKHVGKLALSGLKWKTLNERKHLILKAMEEYASQFKAGEPYRLERPVEGGVIGTEFGCNNVWISPTGALMSDNDYQFLSDSQKEQMRPYKQE